MHDAATLQKSRSAAPLESFPSADSEAVEVARLLSRAGIDHTSSLWFQLIELATQRACEWTERAAASSAPLSARAAAVLGLRSLAAAILCEAQDQDEAAAEAAAAEACLAVCAEDPSTCSDDPPERRRRWGEGATPRRPLKGAPLLEIAAGCC